MSTIASASVSPSVYDGAVLTAEEPSPDLSPQGSVLGAPPLSGSAIDPAVVETSSEKGLVADREGDRALSKITSALSAVIVALIELVTNLLSPAKEKGVGEGKKGDSKDSTPIGSKPPVSAPPIQNTAPSTGVVTRLQAVQDDKGVVTVRSPDGYLVRAEGHHQAWTITAPDGKSTKIFGDPHVRESDGTTWDFKERSTFVFGRSKATVETVPARNGTTFSKRVTIYHGADRVTIGGIDTNRPTIVALSGDGRQHDDGLSDGVHYVRRATKNGESWVSVVDGKKKTMGVK